MNFFLKRKKLAIIIFLLIFGFFVGKYFFLDSKKTVDNFTILEKGDIKEELTLSGKIEAEEHVVLQFQTAGMINWIGVKEGDWIKKYQGIASIDKEKLEAALRQARQDFTAAKAESEKYYAGNYLGNAESYDQKIARTALDATQNKAYDSVRIAEENLKNVLLYSPIEGLVVEANPSLAGVNISASNLGKYEIVNPETIYFKVTADQTEVINLKEDQKGTIVFDSYTDEKIEGTVKTISFVPSKEETETVYVVKALLLNANNSDYKYKIGMTGDIDFILKEKNNVLIAPIKYIKTDNNGKYVLVGKNKKKTYVKTGIENTKDIEIIEGLSEKDIIYD